MNILATKIAKTYFGEWIYSKKIFKLILHLYLSRIPIIGTMDDYHW